MKKLLPEHNEAYSKLVQQLKGYTSQIADESDNHNSDQVEQALFELCENKHFRKDKYFNIKDTLLKP